MLDLRLNLNPEQAKADQVAPATPPNFLNPDSGVLRNSTSSLLGQVVQQAIDNSQKASEKAAQDFVSSRPGVPQFPVGTTTFQNISGGSSGGGGFGDYGGPFELPSSRGKISWFDDASQAFGRPDHDFFLAMRWPKGVNPRGQKVLLTADNGRQVVVEPSDWGPASWTNRDYDVSRSAIDALGVDTDNFVSGRWVDPNTPVGPIR